MKLAPFSIAAAFCFLPAFAEVFPAKPASISDKGPVVLRGIINAVSLPVGDEAELPPVQSAYVLFVPAELTCEIEEVEGKREKVTGVTMLHVVPSEELSKKLEQFTGKPVEVSGKIFGAHTRYHRTPVLIDVEKITLVGK
jgi:hypothetical protein